MGPYVEYESLNREHNSTALYHLKINFTCKFIEAIYSGRDQPIAY